MPISSCSAYVSVSLMLDHQYRRLRSQGILAITLYFKPFPMICTFVAPAPLGSPAPILPGACAHNFPHYRYPTRPNFCNPKFTAQLSSPFPQTDAFVVPQIAFPSTSTSDVRPELLGALLWSVALYLGFSQTTRWSDKVRHFLASTLETAKVPTEVSEFIADIIHTIPFLFGGLGLDASLRVAGGGSTIWGIATGTSALFYAGSYELARQSISRSRVSTEDANSYSAFIKFADRKLQPRGMCHLLDVRNAIKADPTVWPQLRSLSDVTLHRFVRNRFPKARRSPNGFYRGLSIRQVSNGGKDSES